MDRIHSNRGSSGDSGIDRVERAPDKRERDQLDEQGRNFSEKLGEKKGEKNQGDSKSAGDAILSQFMGQESRPTASLPSPMDIAAPSTRAESISPAQNISRVAEVIADRILVSDSQFTDQKMISIRVKNDILPQTEIRVSMDGPELKIQVLTGNADSFQFLGSQKDGLVKHLQSALPQSEISVSVDMEGAADGGDTGDGRSRNQRDIYEELQEQSGSDTD